MCDNDEDLNKDKNDKARKEKFLYPTERNVR